MEIEARIQAIYAYEQRGWEGDELPNFFDTTFLGANALSWFTDAIQAKIHRAFQLFRSDDPPTKNRCVYIRKEDFGNIFQLNPETLLLALQILQNHGMIVSYYLDLKERRPLGENYYYYIYF